MEHKLCSDRNRCRYGNEWNTNYVGNKSEYSSYLYGMFSHCAEAPSGEHSHKSEPGKLQKLPWELQRNRRRSKSDPGKLQKSPQELKKSSREGPKVTPGAPKVVPGGSKSHLRSSKGDPWGQSTILDVFGEAPGRLRKAQDGQKERFWRALGRPGGALGRLLESKSASED